MEKNFVAVFMQNWKERSDIVLKIKTLVFVQDESYDDSGIHITDLYNKKYETVFLLNPTQSAEECIKENIGRTLSKIMEDIDRTLEVEPTNDIKYFYEKNMICGMWENKEMGDKNG